MYIAKEPNQITQRVYIILSLGVIDILQSQVRPVAIRLAWTDVERVDCKLSSQARSGQSCLFDCYFAINKIFTKGQTINLVILSAADRRSPLIFEFHDDFRFFDLRFVAIVVEKREPIYLSVSPPFICR